MNPQTPLYSVIVPVYNSEHTLPELIERIEHVMQQYAGHELILIDDLSTDGSWEKLLQLKKGRTHIRLLRLTKNFGQAAAIICGINEARADTLITIDDDLQYPPEEIHKLIEKFDPKKHYLVCGVAKEKKAGIGERLTSRLAESLINKMVLGKHKKLRFSTFRILRKKTHSRHLYSEKTMRSIQVFFTMVSPRLVDYVYVTHAPRKKGRSNYNFFKRGQIALELILTTTKIPSFLFLSLFIAGVSGIAVLVVLQLLGCHVAEAGSWLLILVLSGLCILFLGLMVLFSYLKKLYLGYLGAEAYAIWEEA